MGRAIVDESRHPHLAERSVLTGADRWVDAALHRTASTGEEHMIRPTEMEVINSNGIAVDIRIDPESLMEEHLFFRIEQDGESISVTLDCLPGLNIAARQLTRGLKP